MKNPCFISSHNGVQKLISFLCVHFSTEKSYDGTHLAFGDTLDRRCHFKHVSLKQSVVLTFIKSWKQLLYPRVIEVCCQPFEPHHVFFLHLIIVVEFFPACLDSGMWRKTHVSSPVTMESRNSSPSCAFTLALRNRMTERTSNLATLWIGTAISNTFHSNKALS